MPLFVEENALKQENLKSQRTQRNSAAVAQHQGERAHLL